MSPSGRNRLCRACDSRHGSGPGKPKGHLKAPVTGTFRHGRARGHFDGRFMPKKFTVRHGVLEATGLLRGKLVRANGMKLGTVHRTVTMLVRTPKGGAVRRRSVQHPEPASRDAEPEVVGLVVHLNPVHLIITAVPGAGNLLGNLLCQITGLLNGTGIWPRSQPCSTRCWHCSSRPARRQLLDQDKRAAVAPIGARPRAPIPSGLTGVWIAAKQATAISL